MKISELLNELERLMWQHGDVEVYQEFWDDPPGLYLN